MMKSLSVPNGIIMFKTISTLSVLAVLVFTGAANARTALSYDKAVDICTDQAVLFGKKPFGRFADEPPPNLVQDQFRACVYGYSQRYPAHKVKYRETVFRLQRILE